MRLIDVQIDRLVGPTHHFGGLGVGNVASQTHQGQVSNPAAAALQGLDKMQAVAGLGVPQVVLPPQPRPDLAFLRALGFTGKDSEILPRVFEESPDLLSAATSCSAMWTANAATVTPAIDSGAESATATIANLSASLHRAIESESTRTDLQRAVPTQCDFDSPLPGGAAMRDEGAANHMRLGTDQDQPGIHVFVYGNGVPKAKKFWPRQTLAACQAIARLHQLTSENVFYLKQHPHAIDAGAFHNDVVALSHQRLLIHHQHAFADGDPTLDRLEKQFFRVTGNQLSRVEVPQERLSIEDAVQTYLFNSQVVSPADRSRPVILCPAQVRQNVVTRNLVKEWCQRGLFREVIYVPLEQSMSAGGGPACLRLRIPLAENVVESISTKGRWSMELDKALRSIITKYYPTELALRDLADPSFVQQTQLAHSKLIAALV